MHMTCTLRAHYVYMSCIVHTECYIHIVSGNKTNDELCFCESAALLGQVEKDACLRLPLILRRPVASVATGAWYVPTERGA